MNNIIDHGGFKFKEQDYPCPCDGDEELKADNIILIRYSASFERQFKKIVEGSDKDDDYRDYYDQFNDIREEQWQAIMDGESDCLATPIFCVNFNVTDLGYEDYPSGWNYGLSMETYSSSPTCEGFEVVGFNGIEFTKGANELWTMIQDEYNIEDIDTESAAENKAKSNEQSYWDDVGESRKEAGW